ncbi:hypothetical protein [uncultured Chitinophaga sp.]|uniref:hypothetical protein n=1 Tax=uncultured Chitinophaga sp. TaxID=339340 RepID=UPI002600D10A|nr:hypothetical protein [uncultured Chitinophaga sp.]
MKRIFSITCMLLALFVHATQAQSLDGAWELKDSSPGVTVSLIIEGNYFMQSVYNESEKAFVQSFGGTLKKAGNSDLEVKMDFNTENKEQVGQTFTVSYSLSGSTLSVVINGDAQEWTRKDDGSGPLAAVWRISAREQEGKMNEMKPGARKTLKILSGGRFQWAAINTETGEFFGTGGGTYTFKDGKYTENIKFFSRDGTRVGMSLTFDGKVEGDNWHHSGLSSKGEKISEIWTKVK